MPGKQDWETPWTLFNRLDDTFHFTLDGAARLDNAKCDNFITEKQNAHTTRPENEVIFCNPPYADIDPWVSTFQIWAQSNIVVTLLQDKTDTGWWRKLTTLATHVVLLYNRVNFIGTETGNMHGAVVMAFGIPGPRLINLSWAWKTDPYPFGLFGKDGFG